MKCSHCGLLGHEQENFILSKHAPAKLISEKISAPSKTNVIPEDPSPSEIKKASPIPQGGGKNSKSKDEVKKPIAANTELKKTSTRQHKDNNGKTNSANKQKKIAKSPCGGGEN